MKKAMILLAVTCALCGLALGGGKGAVNKIDMVVHTDSGTAEVPAGTVVGSANANTTANDVLIVVVNLDDAAVLEDDPATEVNEGIYDCRIWINDVYVDDEDCLKVNANGQGTANVQVDLTAPPVVDTIEQEDTTIDLNVVVRPYFKDDDGNADLGTPCYVNGPAWKTDISVPLK